MAETKTVPTLYKEYYTAEKKKIFFQSRSEDVAVYELKKGFICLPKTLSVETILFTVYGEVEIVSENNKTWTLKREEYILLPRGVRCQLKTLSGARCIEVEAEKLAFPEEKPFPCKVYCLKEVSLQRTKKFIIVLYLQDHMQF